jgi:hypothetical protein
MTTRRGSTVIEVMLYVALLALITGTLMTFLLNVLGREAKVVTIMEVNQNARFALEKMDATVRNSKDATVPTDGGGTAASLSLTMADAAVSPTVFAVANGVLTMKQGTNAAVPLTSASVKVSNLTFTNLVDPTAHLRTDNTWPPVACDPSVWYGVCCWKGAEYCWDAATAIFRILFSGAKLGTCLQATAAKSVIRMSITVSAPPTVIPGNNFYSTITLYGSSTVPRQN